MVDAKPLWKGLRLSRRGWNP